MNDFKLDEHPKIKPGFSHPEHYFEDFSKRLILELPQQEPKVVPLFSRRKNWITAAAAVLVLGLMLPVYNHYNAKTENLDAATIENYITYQSDISQYDLVNLLDKSDVDNIDFDTKLDDATLEDVLSSTNNLENYLNE